MIFPVTRIRKAFIRLVSVALGLGPGFILPLIVATRYDPRASDGYLFATSFSLVMINVVIVAIENHAMAIVGFTLETGNIGRSVWRSYIRSILFRGIGTIVTVIPLLFSIYLIRDARWLEFWPVVLLVSVAPIAGVFSGVASGVLYSAKRSNLPIWTQGLRSLLPIAILLIRDSPPLVALAAAFSLGEVCRAVILHFRLKAVLPLSSSTDDLPLRHDGLFWQFGSSGVSQGNPVVDRLVLAGSGAGSITAYEIADKITFAAYQVIYAGILVPRSGGWPGAFKRAPTTGMRLFWRQTITAMALLFGLAAAIALLAVLALATGVVPNAWEVGVSWSIVALPSVVFSIGQMAAVRFLVILHAEKALLPATTFGFGLNIVADLIFFAAFGGIGIIVATLITRFTVCLTCFAVVWKQQRLYVERGSNLSCTSEC